MLAFEVLMRFAAAKPRYAIANVALQPVESFDVL